MDQILALLGNAPPFLIYLTLGLGAAVENIIPPIPADTFVLIGGFLAARDRVSEVGVFFVTWTSNVVSALAVFVIAYRHGNSFFQTRLGRYFLRPTQLKTIRRFYDRWGSAAIFYTRFLPGLRVVAPVFAGITQQKPWLVAMPLLVASAIWYGGLTWAGLVAGRNLEHILVVQTRVNTTLAAITVIVSVLIGWWWVRSRRSGKERGTPGSATDASDKGAT